MIIAIEADSGKKLYAIKGILFVHREDLLEFTTIWNSMRIVQLDIE